MTRLALCVAVLTACASESNGSDVLCDPTDGVWTRLFVAEEACTIRSLGAPDFGAAYQEKNCRAMVEPLLAAGTVKLADASVIERCRSAIETTCQPSMFKDYQAATRICDDVLVGLQQTGEACSGNDDCAGSSFCARPGTCGTCSPMLANGTPCESSSQCSSGVCSVDSCVAANLPSGSACTVDAMCGTGLECVASVCTKPLAAGQICTNGAGCDIMQTSCVTPTVDGVFDEHGKCVALGKAGASCSPFGMMSDRPKCNWTERLGCISGVCRQLPEVAIGAACGFDTARCAGSAFCSNGACRKVASENEFCDDSISCGPYAFCNEHACVFSDFNAACYPEEQPEGPGF